MWGEQEEMGGGFPLDKWQTPSSASPVFDQPPPPAVFTPQPHSEHVGLFWWVRYTGSPPPPPPIHLSSLWQQILAGLAVLADIEEAAPGITLPTLAHLLTHCTLFSSPSLHSLDWKQEQHFAIFPPSHQNQTGGAESLWVWVTVFSQGPVLTTGWHGYKRLQTAWTIDKQERRAKFCLRPSLLPTIPSSFFSSNPPLLTALFWHMKEEANYVFPPFLS